MLLVRSALTVGGLTLCSRIFGYIRDILIARFLGTGGIADAFFVAFRLPNFFRQLSAEGAFHNAFIPMFSGAIEQDKKDALRFARHVFSFMAVVLTLITIVMEIFMEEVMLLLAVGFIDDGEKFAQAVLYGRIVFPYLIFISLIAMFGGMLNSIGKFAPFASVSIILNIAMIIGVSVVSPYVESPALALSYAVIVGGLIQLVWMIFFMVRYDMMFSLCKPKLSDDVKQLLKRMVPGLIAGGVYQLNVWIGTLLATLIPGAVSYIYYADRLMQFPMAIIGTAIGTAMLPLLSRQIKAGRLDEVENTQNHALELSAILILPATGALMVMSEPIIHIMFERGEFDANSTYYTAMALQVLAMALPALVLIKLLTTVFFAQGDTKSPLIATIIAVITNIVISLSFMPKFGFITLPVATVIAAWVDVLFLAIVLKRRGSLFVARETLCKMCSVIMSACFMTLVVAILCSFSRLWWFDTTLIMQIPLLAIIIAAGVMSFFSVLFLTCGYSPSALKVLLRR